MARLLPEKIVIKRQPQFNREDHFIGDDLKFHWKTGVFPDRGIEPEVLETEWLYVMQLVEQKLDLLNGEMHEYTRLMNGNFLADFNQRATAMCRVKGIEWNKAK